MFWFTTREAFQTKSRRVKDWLRFPELRLLDRFNLIAPALLAAGMFALGAALHQWAPSLGVTGPLSGADAADVNP